MTAHRNRGGRIGLLILLSGVLAFAIAAWMASPAAVSRATPPLPGPPTAHDLGRAPEQPDTQGAAVAADASQRTPASAPTAPARKHPPATPAQRRDDALRLARDPDLTALREALAVRAEAGDADAAWMLAQLYQSCARAWLMSAQAEQSAQMRGFMRAAGQGEAEIAAIDALMASWQQRCAGFGGGPALALLAQSWQARALALGSPEARLAAEPPSGRRDPALAERLLQDGRSAGIELLQRREAIDLLLHSAELARHAPYQRDAFALAGCRLIADCRADPRGWWLRQLGTLAVDASGGIALADSMPPRQWLIVEGQAAEIVRLWQAGRHDDLLRGQGAGALGGGG